MARGAAASVIANATWVGNGAGPLGDNSPWSATISGQFVRAGALEFSVEPMVANGEEIVIAAPESSSTPFGFTVH
jgi:hypothetical protein